MKKHIDLPDIVMSLHKQTREELENGQKHFLMPKPREYFERLLKGEGGDLLGAMNDTIPVGIAAVLYAESLTEALNKGLITYPDSAGEIASLCGKGKIGVVQSLCVLKEHIRKGHSCGLLKVAAILATKRGCSHLLAQIASDNEASKKSFDKLSFSEVSRWTCEHERILLHKPLPCAQSNENQGAIKDLKL